nr:hypothetical protein [Tanacetum cinerariifolium]
MFVTEQPILPAPAVDSVANVLAKWNAIYDAYNEVTYLMLGSMTPELHRKFENYSPYEMLKELKSMFEKYARVERFDCIQTFHACKYKAGKPVVVYVLKMKGYVEQLECLGYMLPQDLSVGLILNVLNSDFARFAETSRVMAIRSSKIQKANKKVLKANGKGKDKQVYIPKPINPKLTAKEHPAKDDTYHHYKECLRGARKLEQGALYLYVGNGVRAQVEAIGSFNLVLPNGLVICLDNYHYAPTITRGVVSIYRLIKNGFTKCFMAYGILVSKNNVLYFNAIPRDGIYEIDMHNLIPLVNSIYNVSNKRANHNLDSTYLWHYHLAHITKKRKMTRKPFLHRTERETNLLGIIHIEVCGPLRHVSRQGYPQETMSYYFYFSPEHKTVVARYVEFFEKSLITQEVSGRARDLEEI